MDSCASNFVSSQKQKISLKQESTFRNEKSFNKTEVEPQVDFSVEFSFQYNLKITKNITKIPILLAIVGKTLLCFKFCFESKQKISLKQKCFSNDSEQDRNFGYVFDYFQIILKRKFYSN